MSRAERSRKRRRKQAHARNRFLADPYGYTEKLLEQKRSGTLKCPIELVEEHLEKVHSDPQRDEQLSEWSQLLKANDPEVEFDESEPKLKEVKDVIRKARAGSAPGPNGITYRVYKNCPRLVTRIWKLFRTVWRRGKLAESWHRAEGCFIPKEEGSTEINQFRTISLLNVEGKMFLAIVARRLSSHLLKNKYIDTSVQKGGVPGIPGCVEHSSMITAIIREAKERGGDLAVIWLDLANAYGTIPHKLIAKMLEIYKIPSKTQSMLQSYYDKLVMRFTVNGKETKWQRLEVGIITGCTVSVILFAAAMNLIVKSVEKMNRGPTLRSSTKQPPIRIYVDDMTITTKSQIEGRWTLEALEEGLKWAKMKLKPMKSRSLVLKKGKVDEGVKFRIQGDSIPSIHEKPIKYLGKWFRASLNDKESVYSLKKTLTGWLRAVDKTGLPGKFRAWIYQNGVLPRVAWPLMLYEIPMTTINQMETEVTKYLRKWFGVPKSFSRVGFYSRDSKLALPVGSLSEEYMVSKVRLQMTLRDSNDPKVSSAQVDVRSGKKFRAADAVQEAEGRLRHQDIVGSIAKGRQGLGTQETVRWSRATEKERRKLVQEEVRRGEEEKRQVQAASQRSQGSWTRWEGVRQRKLKWHKIWEMDEGTLRFTLKAVYDVLPSPLNLHIWGSAEEPKCKLCERIGSLDHILSACPTSLADGRYTWRHNQVLRAIAEGLEEARKKQKCTQGSGPCFVPFVRSGEEGKTRREKERGILPTASDWKMKADIDRMAHFPRHIISTDLRPDIVLWSDNTRQVAMIELTVPSEERIEEAHERKREKYEDLVASCREKKWKTWLMPVEVGCRGFVGHSLWSALNILGIVGKARRAICEKAAEEAVRASRWIWTKRKEKWSQE